MISGLLLAVDPVGTFLDSFGMPLDLCSQNTKRLIDTEFEAQVKVNEADGKLFCLKDSIHGEFEISKSINGNIVGI